MSILHPLRKYTIRYDTNKKLFVMHDANDNLIGEDINGRELGRDAWMDGAEEVCYDYDLGLDEHILLKSIYDKLKAQQ